MNNDDFESVASWLEAELSRYTIAISAMVVIVVAVAFLMNILAESLIKRAVAAACRTVYINRTARNFEVAV